MRVVTGRPWIAAFAAMAVAFGACLPAPAAIVGKDDRGRLTVLGPKLGLSAEEIEQARKSTGLVICGRIAASGALVGSNQVLLTTAHTFIDEKGRTRKLKNCYFRTQEKKPRTVKLDLRPGSVLFGQQYAAQELIPDDYAVARLAKPLDGAEPFLPPTYWFMPHAGDSLIAFSALMKGMTRPDLSQPIVQACTVRQVISNDQGRTRMRAAPLFLSDCDLDHGGSGSINLSREQGGQLVIRGIFRGGPVRARDHWEYDGNLNSRRANFAVSVIIGPLIMEQIELIKNGGDTAQKPN